MKDYFDKDIVSKEHAKTISGELRKRGSRTPKALCLSKDRSLANLLSLACGGGTYALDVEDIVSIGNSEFSINKEGVEELCSRSLTRLACNK